MNAQTLALLNTVVATADAPTKPARKGTVRWQGKAVYDDTGVFHPLGMTFFWAMQGWRNERPRFLANLDWLIAACLTAKIDPPDYLRQLCQVDWLGNAIDPTWPEYDDVFLGATGETQKRGMRTEATVFGSPYNDPVALAVRLSRLIARHPAGFMDIETWNEWAQNGGSIESMQQCARVFLVESGVPLVALSSDIIGDDIADATAQCGASMGTAHTDRSDAEGGWRMVRQGFDAKATRVIYSGNEPPGPHSSVGVLHSPLQLAMLRAVTIQSGGALWLLHVGDMVMGIEDPGHDRHPNLWQVQMTEPITGKVYSLIDALKAVRAVDAWMPANVENWQKSAGNPNIQPQALVCDITGWPDGGEGTNRCYNAWSGDGRFTQVLCGIKGRRTFTQVCPDGGTYHITGINPETDERLDWTLASGQTVVIDGPANGLLGYILNGVRVPGPAARAVVYPPLTIADDVRLEL
jgi:hypothetical protein